jgi:hypothetical protein
MLSQSQPPPRPASRGVAAAISRPFRFTPLSRDRLAIEVKGLTAAPVAAVNGTDLT